MSRQTCFTTVEWWIKRHSRHLNIAIITGITLAVLIYNLQDYITPIVESHDICKNDNIIEISSWLLPRINAHCNEILYMSAGNHESADIAIIIDLYSGVIAVYLTLVNIAYLMYARPDIYLEITKARWYKITSKNHATLLVVLPFSLVVLFFIIRGFYFGHPLIPEEGAGYLTRSMSILHSHIGFGAATQIFLATAVSVFPGAAYAFYVVVKEDMAKDRGTN